MKSKGSYLASSIGKILKGKERLWVFILPSFIAVVAITIGPLIFSVYMGFLDWTLLHPHEARFVGLGNYVKMVHSPEFWHALWLSFYQVGATVSLQLVLGLGCALILSKSFRGIRVLRALYLFPMMTTPVVVGLSWKILLNTELGLVNYFLGFLGIPPINWLSDPRWAMPSIILVDIWRSTPFVTMILLAGLLSLPTEPYEAAQIDGCSRRQALMHITLPLLRPFIALAVLFRTMDAFRRFDTIYVMTGGGPGNSTEILNLYTFYTAFEYFDTSYGAALSNAMLLIILIFSLWVLKRVRKVG